MKKFFERLTRMFEKREVFPTAEEAYYTTMYGVKMTLEEEIAIHRSQISSLIRSKMMPEYDGTLKTQFSSHYCVYDIPEDVSEYTSEIFEPFLSKGFYITCISSIVPQIRSKHLYLISWDTPNRKQ